jgi:hypothetical protein
MRDRDGRSRGKLVDNERVNRVRLLIIMIFVRFWFCHICSVGDGRSIDVGPSTFA